jgi:glycosyltransferase involved in cell wall biosynthesis
VKPDELARLYASVDMLTICSEVEIRSMVGGEALVSGCPILVSEKSGIAPLFSNTQAMHVVTGGTGAWAEAIGDLASNSTKRAAMRAVAASYAQSSLASWQEVLAEDLFPVWSMAAGRELAQAA